MGLIQIQCKNLNNISWLNAGSCSFRVTGQIDLWRVKVTDDQSTLDKCLAIMAPGEIAQGNRFFQAKDRNRHIITRGALRTLLSKYLNQQPDVIRFEATKTNKPFLPNNIQPPVYFNVSHSGNWVLIGVTSSELGVDVEYIKPEFNFQEIIHQNFSPKENEYITECDALKRFFQLWTRKEALLKATGQGLNNDLSEFSCLDGDNPTQSSLIESANNWLINSFWVDNTYWGAVCADQAINGLAFWDFSF